MKTFFLNYKHSYYNMEASFVFFYYWLLDRCFNYYRYNITHIVDLRPVSTDNPLYSSGLLKAADIAYTSMIFVCNRANE